jgi:mannosyltransferase OCH1-like enzyme
VFSSGPFEPESFEGYNKEKLPKGTYIWYNNYETLEKDVKDISEELELLGIKGAYGAFKMLRARAYRADLWRWMALWKYGGIYIDAKLGFSVPVEEWVDFENDEFLLCLCTITRAHNGMIVMS